MFIAIGHKHWPWSELVNPIFDLISTSRPIPIVDQLIVWILIGAVGVGVVVAWFRLLFAALGLDRGQISASFSNYHLTINGSTYDWRFIKGFEIEPHYLGKVEGHNEKHLGHPTNLYYRDAFILVLQYGNRRIELAQLLGRRSASSLLAQTTSARRWEACQNRHRYAVFCRVADVAEFAVSLIAAR